MDRGGLAAGRADGADQRFHEKTFIDLLARI